MASPCCRVFCILKILWTLGMKLAMLMLLLMACLYSTELSKRQSRTFTSLRNISLCMKMSLRSEMCRNWKELISVPLWLEKPSLRVVSSITTFIYGLQIAHLFCGDQSRISRFTFAFDAFRCTAGGGRFFRIKIAEWTDLHFFFKTATPTAKGPANGPPKQN